MNRRYLMVLPVPAFRTGAASFEIESAFAQHLRLFRSELGELAETLVLAGPELSAEARAAMQGSLSTIDEDRERIIFCPMFALQCSHAEYWLGLPQMVQRLTHEVLQASVVHSGVSTLYRPFEMFALLLGRLSGKKTISITDIDHRGSARMNYATGRWTLRQYLTTRLVHDSWWRIQHVLIARGVDLVLLKGQSMVEHYGAGRANVKGVLDAAHSAEHLIPEHKLTAKQQMCDSQAPLRVCYFGRLVEYKGLTDMLQAVAWAKLNGAGLIFEIIGSGALEGELRAQVAALELEETVQFVPAIEFGPRLFERLYEAHVLLAAPQSEDTPRSALDACAAGLQLLAYDTYYYKELKLLGAPVQLVPWRDVTALGQALVELCANRKGVAAAAEQARLFAERNTQQIWLQRRVAWTRELFS